MSEQPVFSSTNSDLGPGLAAIGGSENTPLGLRTVGVSQRTGQHHVRVLGIDHQTGNASRLLQSHERPRLARVEGLVDALADRDVAANLAFTRTGPDRIRIGSRNRQRTDRLDRLAVEHRLPIDAGVDGLVDASRRRADVVDVWVAGHACGGREAITFRADEPPMQPPVDIAAYGRRLLRMAGSDERHPHQRDRCRQDNSFQCVPHTLAPGFTP